MVCSGTMETGVLLYSVLFSVSFVAGPAEAQQNSVCRPVCSDGNCIAVNWARVDFQRAEDICRDRNGDLLRLDSGTQRTLFDHVKGQLRGHFWIGLRLPPGDCSDLSLPLRGYRWWSGRPTGTSAPSSVHWTHSVRVCSPSCVSVSDQGWTERPCSEAMHGFLCQTMQRDACVPPAAQSRPHVFRSSRGCSTAPCEHECTEVTGGYICSCYKDYIPDSSDRHLCTLTCGRQSCPVHCDKDNVNMCYCPYGYVKSEDVCIDIDECQGGFCEQGCQNSFGSFECSCSEGFDLRQNYRCVPADVTMTTDTPAANNTLRKTSSAPAARVLWVWVFIAGAVVVLICGVRVYVAKRQKCRQQSDAAAAATAAPPPAAAAQVPVADVEC